MLKCFWNKFQQNSHNIEFLDVAAQWFLNLLSEACWGERPIHCLLKAISAPQEIDGLNVYVHVPLIEIKNSPCILYSFFTIGFLGWSLFIMTDLWRPSQTLIKANSFISTYHWWVGSFVEPSLLWTAVVARLQNKAVVLLLWDNTQVLLTNLHHPGVIKLLTL